jgi:hypothetical protein
MNSARSLRVAFGSRKVRYDSHLTPRLSLASAEARVHALKGPHNKAL